MIDKRGLRVKGIAVSVKGEGVLATGAYISNTDFTAISEGYFLSSSCYSAIFSLTSNLRLFIIPVREQTPHTISSDGQNKRDAYRNGGNGARLERTLRGGV